MVIQGNRILLYGGIATVGVVAIWSVVNNLHKAKVKQSILDAAPNCGGYNLAVSSAFDSNYYKSSKDTLITQAQAKTYADRIYNDSGIWGSGDDDIIAVIKNLVNKSQVSQVADAFNTSYPDEGGLLKFLLKALIVNRCGNILRSCNNENFMIITNYIKTLK